MDGVVEIITGRERRRRWSVDDKLRRVAECLFEDFLNYMNLM